MKARLPAAERRQQLLGVALEMFSRHGFNQTSMNDIAEAAGVTKPVLYQHFGSKRALFLELIREVGSRLRADVGKAIARAEGPRQQVENGVRAYFRWVAANRDGFAILFSGDTRHDDEFTAVALTVEHEVSEAVAALIVVDGLDEGRRHLLAYGVVGLTERVARHWMAESFEMSADELATQVSEMAWSGLRGLRSSDSG